MDLKKLEVGSGAMEERASPAKQSHKLCAPCHDPEIAENSIVNSVYKYWTNNNNAD